MARKMALVPKEMLASKEKKNIPNPVVQQTLKLDQEMKNVLEQEGIPESQKMQMYGETLGKFLTFYKQQQIMNQPPVVDGTPVSSLMDSKKHFAPEHATTSLSTPTGSEAKPKNVKFSVPLAPQKTISKRKGSDLQSVRKWLKWITSSIKKINNFIC